MPYRINPKTGQREELDPLTGQPIQQPQEGMEFAPPAGGVQEPKRGGLFSNVKQAFSGFFPATKNYVQDVSAHLGVKSKEFDAAQASIERGQAGLQQLTERARKETDPVRKKKLMNLVQEQSKQFGELAKEIQPEYSEDIDKNPLERGLAVGAEIAPLAMTPTAGAIKGAGFKAAARRVGSMAVQGGAMAAARPLTSLKDMTPEERLTESLKAAGMGALLVGGIQAGGEIISGVAKGTSTIGKKTEQAGSSIRQSVRKIKEPAGVWGAQKEDAINETLTKLDINGTAAEQYKQLATKYDDLTAGIDDYLTTKKVPVKAADINAKITTDLRDIPGDVLAEKQGMKEYTKIMKEVAGVKDSQGLFGLKKWLNGRLGRVYTKIEKGNPLSPAEETILQARDTVDGLITELHPEIKDLTMAQSHLRDAAPSLAKARLVTPTNRIAGTTVPTPIVHKASDIIGRGLQKAGGAMSKVGSAEESALSFAAPVTQGLKTVAVKAAPIFASPPNASQDLQSDSEENAGYQESQNQQNHALSVPQEEAPQKTVTGYTLVQLQQAQAKAIQAGAKKAAAQLKQMYDIEAEYQKSQGTDTKAKEYSEGDKKFILAKNEASKALKTLDEGKVKTGKFAAAFAAPAELFGTQSKETTDFRAQLATARTAARNALLGANMSDKELESYLDAIFDYSNHPNVIRQKLATFVKSMQDYEDSIAGNNTNVEDLLQFSNGQKAF